MNRLSLFIVRLVFLLLFIFPINLAQSQEIIDSLWLENNDQGNRFEGEYGQKIGNPSIELVSFWAGFEEYTFGNNQELKIAFFTPESKPYLIKAEEIKTHKYYWMQNKKSQADSGWNEFSPWPVDFLLKDYVITPDNLGILVKLSNQDSETYVPAFIHHSGEANEPKSLIAIFRLGLSISGGRAEVYRGKLAKGQAPDPAQKVSTINIGSKLKGVPLVCRISKESLEEGNPWYTLLLRCRKKNSTESVNYSFTFFYKKET